MRIDSQIEHAAATPLQELVVISGKGGTGKTSIAASLAILAQNAVIADADVDAADMHMLLDPHIIETHEFEGGFKAIADQDTCSFCGVCANLCRFKAITFRHSRVAPPAIEIDPHACEGCGLCAAFCPMGSITLQRSRSGHWMISSTRAGTMVHARLGIAAENSGKLVSIVRKQAREIAINTHRKLIIVDGPPGIGCPVIASVTGASLVLVVTEPTLSGLHDLERVHALTSHFALPTVVCINKFDINEEMTRHIENKIMASGLDCAGHIRFDPAVTRSQIEGKTVVEGDSPAGTDIVALWTFLKERLASLTTTEHACTAQSSIELRN